MEIGNEISQKIRSAIKAKLVDLGAYDDEELPDYVMVMVANKKTQQQMTEDLGLFLGNNTERFTAWLHALLKKLQTITADSKDKAATEKKTLENAVPKQSQPQPVYEESDEPILTLRPETDEFEEEARREAVTSMQQKTARLGVRPSQYSPGQASTGLTRSSSHVQTSPVAKIPATKISPRTSESLQGKHLTSSKGTRSALKSSASAVAVAEGRGTAGARKRRVPGSVIGSVVKHYDEYEEEEYDPHKPLIGKVASKVRVGTRRPTVPPSQQASKSLVMKAMTEAHDSVEKMQRRRPDKSPVRSYPEVRGFGRRHTYREPTIHTGGATRSARVQRVPQEIRTVTRGGPVSRQTEPDRSIQLFSRSKREDIMQRFRAGLSSEEEPEEEEHSTRKKKKVPTATLR